MTQKPAPAAAQRPMAYSYLRFSSAKQAGGDSFERQTRGAQEWCKQNGYVFSTSTFEDLGVSAFKGANVEVGALRAFLEAVENGAVPQGSTLIVENLDRLSRQHWQRGLTLLQDIVESGVNLVTLADGKMFEANQPIDFADGIMLLVGFQRANEESVTKSKRIRSAWKRDTEATKAGDRVRSKMCPAWLQVNSKGDGFTVIKAKAKIVTEVFERFANGERPSEIAKDLHRRGVTTTACIIRGLDDRESARCRHRHCRS